ncbi:MAG: hypothetical protein ACXAB9_13525, partial [Candidatus Thorarchaeota archaeon]
MCRFRSFFKFEISFIFILLCVSAYPANLTEEVKIRDSADPNDYTHIPTKLYVDASGTPTVHLVFEDTTGSDTLTDLRAGSGFTGMVIGDGSTTKTGIIGIRFPGASISTDKTSAGVVTISGSGDVLHTDVSTSLTTDWFTNSLYMELSEWWTSETLLSTHVDMSSSKS